MTLPEKHFKETKQLLKQVDKTLITREKYNDTTATKGNNSPRKECD